MKIIVLGDNHQWGRSDSLPKARKIAGNPRHYIAYEVDDDKAQVNGMGDIVYSGDSKPRLVAKK